MLTGELAVDSRLNCPQVKHASLVIDYQGMSCSTWIYNGFDTLTSGIFNGTLGGGGLSS